MVCATCFKSDGFPHAVNPMEIKSRTGYKIICLAMLRARESACSRPLQLDSSFSSIRKRTCQPVTTMFPLKRKNTKV